MGSPTVANLQALDTTLPRRTPQPQLVLTSRTLYNSATSPSTPHVPSTARSTTSSRREPTKLSIRQSHDSERAGGPAAAFRGHLVATIALRRNSDRLFHQYIQCVHRAETIYERRNRLHAPFWSPKQAAEVAHAIGDRRRTAQWGHAIAPTTMATEIRRSVVS